MHALLIAENWPPRVGGIEHYLTNIAKRLPKKSVTAVVPKSRGSSAFVLEGKGIRQTIRKHFFWPFIRPSWLLLYLYLKRFVRHEKVDVVLCGKALFEGLIGYALKRKLGIPYVIFTYGMEIETWSRHHARKLKKVLKHADRIVYMNDITKKKLLDLGATEKQLVKIWPGIEDTNFDDVDSTQVDAVIKKYQLEQPYIVSVGRLIPRKGFDLLLQAFSNIDQTKFEKYRLVVVGEGPEREKLEETIEQQFMSSVDLLGYVPEEDLKTIYAGAQLFALTPVVTPEDLEGFGIVFLEAAVHGLPSVTTLGSGAAEAVVHKKTGLVVQPTEAAVKEALEYLLSNTQERKQFGDAAKTRAYNEFRWSKRILLVKGMIDAILSEKVLAKVHKK